MEKKHYFLTREHELVPVEVIYETHFGSRRRSSSSVKKLKGNMKVIKKSTGKTRGRPAKATLLNGTSS